MIAISYDASRAKVSVMFGPTLYYVRLSCIDYIQYSERYSKQVKYLTILCIRCYVIVNTFEHDYWVRNMLSDIKYDCTNR